MDYIALITQDCSHILLKTTLIRSDDNWTVAGRQISKHLFANNCSAKLLFSDRTLFIDWKIPYKSTGTMQIESDFDRFYANILKGLME